MSESTNPEPPAAAGRAPARITPYELAFGESGFEERVFVPLEAEAERLGIDPVRAARFGFLTTAADALRELVPTEADPDALEQHRALLYHAFNFWRFGKRLYLLGPAVARYLVEAEPQLPGAELGVPHRSFYLQLPARLFWASIAPDTPPEPIDGFFVTTASGKDANGAPVQDLNALMVLGIRRDRAGFSVISFETQTGPQLPAAWVAEPGRPEGRDFENLLPGGELAGLYSIVTTLEALKLLARVLDYIAAHSAAVVWEEPAEPGAATAPGALRSSRLAFYRIELSDAQPEEGKGS